MEAIGKISIFRLSMKRILVLKACGSSDEPHECNGICEQATLYGIEAAELYGLSGEEIRG